MNSTPRDRAVDLAIAGTLAVLPLLPTGPSYFGWHWQWALEAAFVIAAILGALVLVTTRMPAQSSSGPRGLHSMVACGYLWWLIPMVGATVIGLLERNPPDLALFRIQSEGLVSRLTERMHQAADPLYPLRVGLTVLEGGVMFFLLSALLRKTATPGRRARTVAAGCLLGMTIVSIVAVAQYVTGTNLHHYWVTLNPHLTRSHATLDDPNALASFLVLGIGLAAGVAWSSTSGRRALALVAAAIACVALVTTVSRAGVAALAIAAGIAPAAIPNRMIDSRSALRRLRSGSRAAVMAGAVALVVWGIAFAVLPKHTATRTPETPVEALVQTIDPRQPVSVLLKGRHLLWDAGWQIVTQHWVAGAGLGQFPRLVRAYPGAGGPENAHNYFLQVLAEGGIVAFAGLLALLGSVAWVMYRAVTGGDLPTARFALGLSVGLVGFVLTWMTGHPLLTLSNQLWFAAVLALGLAVTDAPCPATLPPQVSGATPLRRRLQRASILVVVASTLAVAGARAKELARAAAGRPHAVGVYGWEPGPPGDAWPGGTTFRWTRRRAALLEPVRGRVLQLPIFLARPDMDRHAVVVDVKIAGVVVPSLTLRTNGWHVHTYDLPALLGEAGWRAQHAITIEVTVDPTFVPADLGGSNDTRELGIGVGGLRWQQ